MSEDGTLAGRPARARGSRRRAGRRVLGLVFVLFVAWLAASSVVAYRLTRRPRPRFEVSTRWPAPQAARDLLSRVAGHGELVDFPLADHHNLDATDPERFRAAVLGFCRRIARRGEARDDG